LLLVVETYLIEAVIRKRLTAPLIGKVNVPENCLHATAKTEAIISAKHVLITYSFTVDTLPLINI